MQHSVAMAAARCCPPLPRWQKPSVAFPPSEQRSQGSLGQGDPRLESHSTPKQAPPPKPASLQPAAHRHCGRPPSAGAGRAPARTPPPPQIQDFSCGPRIPESRKGRGVLPPACFQPLEVEGGLFSLKWPPAPHPATPPLPSIRPGPRLQSGHRDPPSAQHKLQRPRPPPHPSVHTSSPHLLSTTPGRLNLCKYLFLCVNNTTNQ